MNDDNKLLLPIARYTTPANRAFHLAMLRAGWAVSAVVGYTITRWEHINGTVETGAAAQVHWMKAGETPLPF